MGRSKSNRKLADKKPRAAPPPPARGSSRTGMSRDIAGVVLLFLGIALGLSLVTWSSMDGQLLARGLPVMSNFVGPVGHRVAAALYAVFGFAALTFPLALSFGALKLFRREPTRLTLISSLAYAVLAVSGAILFHLALASAHLSSFSAGGAVGRVLGERARGLVSTPGSVLVVSAVALIAVIVATDLQISRLASIAARAGAAIGRGARAAWMFLGRQITAAVERHRQAVSELRAEEAQWAEMKDAEEEEAAEALAAEAILEAQDEEDLAPARAAAEALAREQIRRSQPPAPAASFGLLASDPAWAAELSASAVTEPPEPRPREKAEDLAAKVVSTIEKPRRKRKAVSDRPEALTDPGMEAVVPPKPEIVLPPTLERAEKAAKPEPEPVAEKAGSLPPPPAAPPEIILSQAMLDRPKRKKEKENPSFAFTQSGDVFKLPATALLQAREEIRQDVDEGGLQRTAATIVATLREHGVEGSIRSIRPGPVVTLFEFLPVAGVKLARIENLDKELTMALSAVRIRIIAPIPGKGVVGIEVPNGNRATVYLRDVFESEAFAQAGGLLPLALGKNIEGLPYCVDLQKMPHLLIAGTTGSGKSVGLNTMILSMLYRQTPDQVRMIMVDPKMTELSIYEDIPHLLLPVVTDPAKAARALQWAVDEMERRTQILADTGVRDLKSYNAKVEKLRLEGKTLDQDIPLPNKKLLVVDVSAGETEEEAQARMAREEAEAEANGAALAPLPTAPYEDPTAPPPVNPANNPAGLEFGPPDRPAQPQKLPYIVVIIDELADLMMTAPREVELSLARLAQKARATGIHLMVATQRPSTDIVTGAIKNNFPARISFRLASRHDSTTIINGPGAESLLGDGDMLIMTATAPVTRVQGAFVAEEEIHRVVAFLKEQGRPVYDEAILKARDGNGAGSGGESDEEDPVYDQALELVCRMDEVSVSKLQREMRLGYNKAAKIIERMEREGIVGPANGVKPRQVLLRPAGEANPMPNV